MAKDLTRYDDVRLPEGWSATIFSRHIGLKVPAGVLEQVDIQSSAPATWLRLPKEDLAPLAMLLQVVDAELSGLPHQAPTAEQVAAWRQSETDAAILAQYPHLGTTPADVDRLARLVELRRADHLAQSQSASHAAAPDTDPDPDTATP